MSWVYYQGSVTQRKDSFYVPDFMWKTSENVPTVHLWCHIYSQHKDKHKLSYCLTESAERYNTSSPTTGSTVLSQNSLYTDTMLSS